MTKVTDMVLKISATHFFRSDMHNQFDVCDL